MPGILRQGGAVRPDIDQAALDLHLAQVGPSPGEGREEDEALDPLLRRDQGRERAAEPQADEDDLLGPRHLAQEAHAPADRPEGGAERDDVTLRVALPG